MNFFSQGAGYPTASPAAVRYTGKSCGCWRVGRLVVTLAAFVLQATPAVAAPQELHGYSDVFSGSGVAIAWGVLRGPTEESTSILLRVVADPAQYSRLAADGVDPFTQRRQSVLPERLLAAQVDIRIPRTHFADFPRTEVRFAAAGGAPALVVYYLGVPDTTPEFISEASLDASLTERIGQLRATRSKPP